MKTLSWHHYLSISRDIVTSLTAIQDFLSSVILLECDHFAYHNRRTAIFNVLGQF